VVLSPGPHAFDLRLGQSIGGVGPASGSGINGNTGLGVGYSTDGGITWQALTDTGTGEFLDTGAAAAHLPSATALSIASGALVDLNGASQTVAAVSGSGVVTNGDLVVTGTLSPSGAGSAGVLTIQGNLRVSEGATVDWDFSSASADRVDVAGTLALPSRAFLTLNGQGATLGMRPMVLFTFRTYNGAPDLSGWSVDRAAKLTVDRVNSQVILTGGSTVMVLK
jgi:hypothetical protein